MKEGKKRTTAAEEESCEMEERGGLSAHVVMEVNADRMGKKT